MIVGEVGTWWGTSWRPRIPANLGGPDQRSWWGVQWEIHQARSATQNSRDRSQPCGELRGGPPAPGAEISLILHMAQCQQIVSNTSIIQARSLLEKQGVGLIPMTWPFLCGSSKREVAPGAATGFGLCRQDTSLQHSLHILTTRAV